MTKHIAAIAVLVLGRNLGLCDAIGAEDNKHIFEGFQADDGLELSSGQLEVDFESGQLTVFDDDNMVLSAHDVVALCSRIPLADGGIYTGADADTLVNQSADQAMGINTGVAKEAHDYADHDLIGGENFEDKEPNPDGERKA